MCRFTYCNAMQENFCRAALSEHISNAALVLLCTAEGLFENESRELQFHCPLFHLLRRTKLFYCFFIVYLYSTGTALGKTKLICYSKIAFLSFRLLYLIKEQLPCHLVLLPRRFCLDIRDVYFPKCTISWS